MLIAGDSRRSRATVLYGILAKSALHQLETQNEQISRSAYLRNLLKLLDHYRLGTLQRPAPKGVLDRRPSDTRSIRQDKVEADAVQAAIARAHEAAYPEMTKDGVVLHLKTVFSMIFADQLHQVPPEQIERVKTFLTELTAALRQS